VAASTAGTLRTCGNEGEDACKLFEKDIFNASCDTGLNPHVERCGCILKGFRGNCLIRGFCNICRNSTRHRPGTADLYAASWAQWALRNQREQLAIDEPINWVTHLGTHNSFNSFSDGHQPRVLDLTNIVTGGILGTVKEILDAPNQFYSMTSQLDLGARILAIDAHWSGDILNNQENARLCHSITEGGVLLERTLCRNPSIDIDGDAFPGMRYFANGIKEIRNWLDGHPEAIVILDLENYVGCNRPHCDGDPAYVSDPLRTYLGDRILPRPGAEPYNRDQPLPSRAEMLAAGKRVVMIFNDKPRGTDDLGFSESETVSGFFKNWLQKVQDFATCVDNNPDPEVTEHVGPANTKRGQFTILVEDRTQQRGFNELLGLNFGVFSLDDLRGAARCNHTIVATDFMGSNLDGLQLGRRQDIPDFTRHEALVWSWKPGDRGQNGNCAMLEASSLRWVSSDCAQSRRYVCAPPRSESGTSDRSKWNMREDRWKITTASGPWQGGPAACAAEFPFDPAKDDTAYVFSVPVNGYQNDILIKQNIARADLWLNYTDQAREGSWVIPRLNVNSPPIADAGPDRTIECGNNVVLNGSASHDADGDALTYTWTGPFGTVTGPVANVRLPAGVHVISLAVADGKGGVGTDSVTVTIGDASPPTLSVTLNPSVLSPPNHRLVPIVADVQASDQCDGADVDIALVSIVISEPQREKDHKKDHEEADRHDPGKERERHRDKGSDIQGADFGTGDLEFSLRAERKGRGPGRTYIVTYRATDSAGNAATSSATVFVPHDEDCDEDRPKRAKTPASACTGERHDGDGKRDSVSAR